MKDLVILLTFLYLVQRNYGSPDYCWKDYYGIIPKDAVVGGRDMAGNNVYIGQGYVPGYGIIPGGLLNGSKTMNVGSHWYNLEASYIKVLCGPQEKFSWLTANRDNLHLLLENKHAVVGGRENRSVKRIGKVNIDGKVRIGKIDMYPNGKSYFYYADGTSQHEVTSYQALIYEDFHIDQRINSKD